MGISVIGGGSWATALVKILTENKIHVNWYLRRKRQVDLINKDGVNPDYLTFVRLNTDYLTASTDLDEVIRQSNKILFVIPSAHFPAVTDQIDTHLIQGKSIITSIKGTIGPDNELPSAFIANRFEISENKQAILAGPCHAEEIAMGKKTYMTIGSPNMILLRNLKPYFERFYLQVNVSADSVGMEYAAIFKNIVGLACGIAKGLNYGDNFIAVLVSNAIYELEGLLRGIQGNIERIACSGYLGDLLVTGYSNHSRNRTFGELIGRGYSVEQTQRLMSMVAEGYGATKGIYETAKELSLNLPIVNTAYRILYKHMSAAAEFKLLERNMI